MDVLRELIGFVLHVDDHLVELVRQYGPGIYAVLFVIVFCETGLVVTPFLPGDSLLFAAGALVAIDTSGTLNLGLLWVLLVVAAILGDTVNYHLGAWVGPRAFRDQIPLLKRSHLERTAKFYERHGAKMIVLARFVPIVRTFAPFVAGIGGMSYRQFITYNVLGGVAWVSIFLVTGYWFGNIPLIRDNFSLVTVAIILISVLPMLFEVLRHRRSNAATRTTTTGAGTS